METTASSLKTKRKMYGWLFIISGLVFFVPDLIAQLFQFNNPQDGIFTHKIESSFSRFQFHSPLFLAFNGSVITSLVTMLTATMSLVGFILYSLFAWQKDKHVSFSMVQESQKLEQILADFQLELDKR